MKNKTAPTPGPCSAEGAPRPFAQNPVPAWLVGIAGVPFLCALLLAGCSPPKDVTPPQDVVATNVTVTPAQRQRLHLQTIQPATFRRAIDTTGVVGFDNDHATTILAPISGPATRLLASLGDQVKAGDPLALIDSPDYAAAFTGYRKSFALAKNARRLAVINAELFKNDAIARRDLEQSETDAIAAEADRDSAFQQLHSLGVDDQTITNIQQNVAVATLTGAIRSPVAGTVVERLLTPGQLLQAATTPCFTVADLSQVWVTANIFESDLAAVAVGDAAEIITSASPNPFPGSIDNISAIIDPATHAIGLRVVAKNPGGLLKKQMYVRVLIHSSRPVTGLLAPVSAILRDQENLPFNYVSRADGSFERRRVTLGYRVGDQYEITSGLQAGDQIVVEGALFVQFLQNQ